MGPTTPNINFQNVGPTSPPETPRAASPSPVYQDHRQKRHAQDSPRSCFPPAVLARPMSQTPNIKPTGNGHHFSYTRPDQLSPRSSSSSSDESDPDSDSSVGPGERGPLSPDCTNGLNPVPESPHTPTTNHHQHHHNHHHRLSHDSHTSHASQDSNTALHEAPQQYYSYHTATTTRIVDMTEANFTVEEVESDSETHDISVVRPHHIEDAESERSRSRSRSRSQMMRNFAGLSFDENAADDEDDEYDVEDYREVLKRLRSERRHRRMTSGSIGKRTISESIGSDDDNEDVVYLDATEVGSSARRLRRKYERHSFLFQDPPAPRIDEMDEPPTTEDEIDDEDDMPEMEVFAKELPYFTMEIDSP